MINHIIQLVSPKVFSVKYEDLSFGDRVIVRPSMLAVCHADQRYYLGQRDRRVLRRKLPMALIHEACGHVVYDPEGQLAPGQTVVMIPNAPTAEDDVILENYRESSHFLSSGYDGFMREFCDLPRDRVVPVHGVPEQVAAITEFVSVAVHASSRFERAAHRVRGTIGVWGDGSLSYTLCNVLRQRFPESNVVVVGMDERKLGHFSFVQRTYMADALPEDFRVDHAFECCGGEGSAAAIDDIIRTIRPMGTVTLMGVSENKVGINTRDILEKGLTLVGCSRSGRSDFETAVSLLEDPTFQKRMEVIVSPVEPVRSISDISRVMAEDLATPFKTVFGWEI